MKHLITKLLLLMLLVSTSTAMAQQWHELHTGATEDLFDVCCIDTNTVFVCGQNGVILKTSNGGTTWVEKFRYDGMDLYDLCFIDDNTGFAIGNYGESLAKTTDGGEHWTWIDIQLPDYPTDGKTIPAKDDSSDFGNLVRIFPIDTDTLYFSLWSGLVAKSTDGGLSASFVFDDQYLFWIVMTWENSMRLYFEDHVGYVFCNTDSPESGVFKTVDYGNTWELVFYQEQHNGIIHFINKDEIRVVYHPSLSDEYLEDENYYYTEDGFASTQAEYSFINQIYGEDYLFYDSKFTTAEKGCFLQRSFDYMYDKEYYLAAFTNDGGLHWDYCNVGNNNEKYLFGVDGVDDTYYIVSEAGTVYTNRAGFNSIQTNTLDDATANPLSLEIYDLQGRLLRTQSDNIGTPNTEGLAPGTYIIRVLLDNGDSFSDKIVKH